MRKLLFVSLTIVFAVSGLIAQGKGRTVSVTIDDLPVVSLKRDIGAQRDITDRLLAHITAHRVPAIGFVNEGKLYPDGALNADRVGLLRSWLKLGLELGNHSYSHKSLHRIPLAEYTADIGKGEKITKRLLREFGMKMRYFRHPFLNTGMSLEVKRGLNEYLSKNEYEIAPVTIDNSDWAFARAYELAEKKGDKKLKQKIGKVYVPYLEAKTEYWEKQSVKLLGRELSQILLLHANAINADYFGDIAKMYRKRSYRFVTLEESLRDEAYKMQDTFVGRAGISWLHRWALARGKGYLVKNEPAVPPFVMKAAGLTSE